MCGITGFFDPDRRAGDDESTATVLRMADTLHHRGPDDRGAWADAEAGIALGFRRLAIVDLSAEGHQPMASASGRYVLAFNGEVYNHADLRRELVASGAAPFRGQSDTEVMLAAFERWGPDRALERFVGMFAFALWDRRERILRLARDRIGEKPLYYGWAGGGLVFGSELKALRAYPGFSGEVDREALALYMRLGYVPAPHSIYLGIRKLPPGTSLTIDAGRTVTAGALPDPVPYWSARRAAEAGAAAPFEGTEAEAADRLEALLREAVGLQMVADVPAGRLPLGRDRLLDDRGPDAGPEPPAGEDVHHRLRGGRLRRGAVRQGGRTPPGDRAHRALRHARRGAGGDPVVADPLRRAVRRLVGHPDLPRLAAGPATGDGEPLGRRRGRALRRLLLVSPDGPGLGQGPSAPAGAPPDDRRGARRGRGPQAPDRPGGAGRLARFVSPDRVGKLADLLGHADEAEDVHWALLSRWAASRRSSSGRPRRRPPRRAGRRVRAWRTSPAGSC